MLTRKFKTILITNPTNSNLLCRPLVQTRSFSKWFDVLSGTKMSSTIRLKVFRDLFLNKFNNWTRSYMVNTVLKRCRTERGINKMFLYFREVFFRPRTQLLVSATATYKNTEDKPGPPKKCSRDIKDKEMRRLIKDLERVEDLSKATLFCEGCDKRVVIDTKHKGVHYCDCPNSKPPVGVFDGWVPYMEAEDVIIWRKEYKPGGLYAYKVYGRYKHLKAEDFAMIQVDGAYRKVWDTAVASISIVEQEANGIKDQAVLHWEVLWPRLFANRDYVYLRRHKEFSVQSRCLVHKDAIFADGQVCTPDPAYEKPSCNNVHAHAKQVSMEMDKLEAQKKLQNKSTEIKDNKVYVIVSRSCTHPEVPESSNAIRVMEYWSHMVITTLNGPDHPGMEFVLTYYDEPAVGGLPAAVTSWAMGRAGPAFLERMRGAAMEYHTWRATHRNPPDFAPFEPVDVSFDSSKVENEEDMESSKEGPDIDEDLESDKVEESTQTRPVIITPVDDDPIDGPRLEVKYAEREYSMPDEAQIDDENNEMLNYHLTLSKITSRDDGVEQLITIDEKSQNLKITIELPISEISRLANRKLLENQLHNKSMLEDNSKDISEVNNKVITADIIVMPPQRVNLIEEKDESGDEDISEDRRASWWRYLHPFYYFGWS